jgi:hypothetical protein
MPRGREAVPSRLVAEVRRAAQAIALGLLMGALMARAARARPA